MRPIAFPAALLVCVLLVPAAAHASEDGEDAEYRKAHHLYQLQEYAMAAETLAKYLERFAASERAPDARLLLAESYYQRKDFKNAAVHFDTFLSAYPKHARRGDALQRAVKAHRLCGDAARSLACAEAFLAENRKLLGEKNALPALPMLFQSVLYYAGDAAYLAKQPEKAKSYWTELRQKFPESKLVPDAAEGLGWIAFDAQQYEEAGRQFAITAAAKDHAKAASSRLMQARCLEREGKTDLALAALDEVAWLPGGKEQEAAVLLHRAGFLARAKRYAEALPHFQKLAKRKEPPEGAAAELAVAASHAERDGKSAEAVVLAEAYLGAFPKAADRAAIARVKALALAAQKKNSEALAAAKAAVKEAEGLPAGAPRDEVELPAALILLAELSAEHGAAVYERIAREHAASRFAKPARYQLAYLAGQAGDLEKALAHAEDLLKTLDPAKKEDADLRQKALFAAGDFAFRKEDYARAETLLEQYRQAAGADAQAALVGLRLGWCRYRGGKFKACEETLSAALAGAKDELRAEMFYLRGLARIKQSAHAAALEDFQALVDAFPESGFAGFAAYEAARFLFEESQAKDDQGLNGQALSWIEIPLKKKEFAGAKLYADALLLRAKARFRAAQYAEALADLGQLQDLPEGKAHASEILLLRALFLEPLAEKGKEAEAAWSTYLDALPKDSPERRTALYRRGLLRFRAKRFEDAKGDFEAVAAAEGPFQAGAALRLALSLKELGDKRALEHLEKLTGMKLDDAEAFEVHFQLANLYYEAGENGKAAGQYRKALERSKEVPAGARGAAALNLAWSLARANQDEQAEAAFAEVVRLDPDGAFAAEARFHRGRLLAKRGNLESALADWQELLKAHPESDFAEKAFAAHADAQARGGRFAEAAAQYEQFLAKYPQSKTVREALCGLAECRLQLKEAGKAEQVFLKALGEKGVEAELDAVAERAVLGMAELALAKGEAAQSKKLALRIVLERPDSEWLDAALYLCGRSSEDLAEPEKAIGYYRKLLSDCPKSARVPTAQERLKALGAPASEP